MDRVVNDPAPAPLATYSLVAIVPSASGADKVLVDPVLIPEICSANFLLVSVSSVIVNLLSLNVCDPVHVRSAPVIDTDPPRATALPSMVIELFTSLALVIDPANILLVITPTPPSVIRVPVDAGNVIVFVPAEEGAFKVIVPELEPEREIEPVVGTTKEPTNVVAVICAAAKFPDESLATIVEFVLADDELNPSNKSASKPDPVPSTVLILVNTSAAV